MKKSIRICDRCSKEVEYGKFPYAKVMTVKRLSVWGFGAHDYLEAKYDLCQSCTKDFATFYNRKEKQNGC